MLTKEKAISPDRLVHTLYVGGLAAILAEILVVLGIIILLSADLGFIVSHQLEHERFEFYSHYLEVVNNYPVAYFSGLLLSNLSQTIAMFFVVWTWHLYFSSEGIVLISHVARNIALIGITGAAIFIGQAMISFPALADAIRSGKVTYREVYGAIAVVEAIYTISVATLYGAYPIFLALASWNKRLLPHRFCLIAIGFGGLNIANLITSYQHATLALITGGAIALFPFLMGVVLLRKAQLLANRLYAERSPTIVLAQDR